MNIDHLLNKVHNIDCLEFMRDMPDGSINCCVTSPPYWGLRDYGVDGQLGLESTPEEYVAKMVAVFAEVKRILRDDGTLWLNLGDSYYSDFGGGSGSCSTGNKEALESMGRVRKPNHDTLKRKDLCGIPWKFALALQEPVYQCQWCKYEGRESLFGKFLNGSYSICPKCAKRHGHKQPIKTQDGWYLRQDIIWHKPNPMPESVKDRCTKAHEYIFLMSKKPMYYCDMDAIKEPLAESSVKRLQQDIESQEGSDRVPGKTNGKMKAVTRKPVKQIGIIGEHENRGQSPGPLPHGETRNKRSVWTVTTKPYKEAHFATFPPDLIKPCILAGCPEEVCKACGEPRQRVVERSGGTIGKSWHDHSEDKEKGQMQGTYRRLGGYADDSEAQSYKVETTGWTDCGCGAGFVPGIVYDPFMGSGTTAVVAYQNNRNYIGTELNPEYCKLTRIQEEKDKYALFGDK